MITIKNKIILLKELLYLKEIIKAGQFQIVAQKNGIKASNLSALINQ